MASQRAMELLRRRTLQRNQCADGVVVPEDDFMRIDELVNGVFAEGIGQLVLPPNYEEPFQQMVLPPPESDRKLVCEAEVKEPQEV